MSRTPRRGVGLDWRAVLGIALGAALLYFSLRGVDAARVLAEIRQANVPLFALSIVFATLPIVVRAWRWKALLEPVRKGTAFRSRYRATMIGFMANNVLPARVGEFARAYTLSRMEPVPVVASIGSLVVERLFDGFVVVAFLLLAMASPGFPAIGSLAGQSPGALLSAVATVLVVLAAALLVMVLWPGVIIRIAERVAGWVLPARFRRPVVDALHAFLNGLGSLRDPRLLGRAAFWSLAVWTTSGIGFWLGFEAFGIDAPFAAAIFLQSLIALAVALPSAPGFFGLWEAAARIGLVDIWGVELDKALGFALGYHIGGFLSVTILGLYYAWRLGLSWEEVGRVDGAAEEGV